MCQAATPWPVTTADPLSGGFSPLSPEPFHGERSVSNAINRLFSWAVVHRTPEHSFA